MRKTLVAALCVLALAACGNAGSASGPQTLTVLAASSLTESFTTLADHFEAEHPGVRVKLVFDSSATLAQQAIERAPGDVLATADRKTMDEAAAGDGLTGQPTEFATNVLVLAVPRDNPARIRSVDDLDKPGVDYLTCVVTAPCGSAAGSLLGRAGISAKPASQEVDVKSVLAKVEAGEADAGLVYRTDVTASAGKVTGIEVPGAAEDPNTYWLAVTADGDRRLAEQWVEYVAGPAGQAVLRTAGFARP